MVCRGRGGKNLWSRSIARLKSSKRLAMDASWSPDGRRRRFWRMVLVEQGEDRNERANHLCSGSDVRSAKDMQSDSVRRSAAGVQKKIRHFGLSAQKICMHSRIIRSRTASSIDRIGLTEQIYRCLTTFCAGWLHLEFHGPSQMLTVHFQCSLNCENESVKNMEKTPGRTLELTVQSVSASISLPLSQF